MLYSRLHVATCYSSHDVLQRISHHCTHTHTHQTSSQQYTAQLKFESASGPKRIDFYHLQSNRALSGRPLATVPLTHVLGVNTTRQHGLSRIKNAFQVRENGGQGKAECIPGT